MKLGFRRPWLCLSLMTALPSLETQAASRPALVASVDIDRNGVPDLVRVDASGRIGVLLAEGNGSFREGPSTSVLTRGGEPIALAAGDLDGDRIPDLVIATSASPDVAILLGQPGGIYEHRADVSVGSDPRSVAAGDLDGDGRLDLVTAGPKGVWIATGEGEGRFGAAVRISSRRASLVAAADFSADDRPDLAFVPAEGGSLALLLRGEDGTYRPGASTALQSAPSSIATGDFDGDGRTDLALLDSKATSLTTLLARKDGTFKATLSDSSVSPFGLAAADFDRDGRSDLAALYASGAPVLLEGREGGGFTPVVSYAHARTSAATDDEEEGEDPDVPPFARGRITKEEYFARRDELVAMRRGQPSGLPYDAREDALRQMKRQLAASPQLSVSSWTEVGPQPIPNGQTQTAVTAVSGRVSAIAVHPTNPSIVYAGTAGGGVYRTLDGGTTWTPIFDSAQSLAIGALAIAPSQTTTLFVGTGEPSQSADGYFGVGLYRIDDAETTATLVGPINPSVPTGIGGTTAFTGRSISEILVHPADANTIFVSTATGVRGNPQGGSLSSTVPPLALRGIYRSTNALAAAGSVAFQKLRVTAAGSLAPDTTGNRSIMDMVFDPADPNVLVCTVVGLNAVNDGGIYRSTNAQAATPTFVQAFQFGSAAGARGELAVNRVASTTTIIAALEESASGTICNSVSQVGALRRSTDGGATWSGKLPGGGGFCGGQCFYNIGVAVDPGNASVIYIGGNVRSTSCQKLLGKSIDGGATTFANADVGLHADNHVIVVAPSNASVVYTGNDGGIYKSTDAGASWTSLNNTGFSATQFQSLDLHPTDREFLLGGTQDNGTQRKRPDGTWTRADFGDGGYAIIDQSAADTTNVTMYHTYFNSLVSGIAGFGRVTNVANAVDGGWAFLGCGGTANGISCGDSSVLFYAPMARGPGNPNTLYYGTDRLYRSINSGTTMTVVSQQFAAGVPLTSIGISPQNDAVRIIGLRNGSVFATTTGANPMTNVTSGSFPANPASGANRPVSRAVIDPSNANTAWVAFSYYAAAGQGVWRNTNLAGGAAGWAPAGAGIPSIPVSALAVDPLDSNTVYAGTDIGVYRTTNGGTSWAPFGTGLPNVAVFDMAIQANHRVLRVATHGRGIWEIAIPFADLSLGKADAPDPVLAGSTITYTLSSTNNGPNDAPDLVISDTLPAGTLFVSASAPGSTSLVTPPVGSGGTVTATWGGNTAPAVTRTLTIQVRTCPDTACNASIANTATTSSAASDTNLGNNSAPSTTAVQARSDLSVTSTHAPEPAGAGGQVTYTLTVANAGPSVDPNPILTQTLPAGWTVVSATPLQGTCVGVGTGAITCNLGPLGAPQPCTPLPTSTTVTVVAQVPVATTQGTYPAIAAVTSSSCLADPNLTNNTVTDAASIIILADVSVLKTDAPDPVDSGRFVDFTITVTNLGPSPAYGVQMTDSIVAPWRFRSVRAPGGWSCTAPYVGTTGTVSCKAPVPLAPGSYSIGIQVQAPPVCGRNTTVGNTASVASASNDPSTTNNVSTTSTLVQGGPCFF